MLRKLKENSIYSNNLTVITNSMKKKEIRFFIQVKDFQKEKKIKTLFIKFKKFLKDFQN